MEITSMEQIFTIWICLCRYIGKYEQKIVKTQPKPILHLAVILSEWMNKRINWSHPWLWKVFALPTIINSAALNDNASPSSPWLLWKEVIYDLFIAPSLPWRPRESVLTGLMWSPKCPDQSEAKCSPFNWLPGAVPPLVRRGPAGWRS